MERKLAHTCKDKEVKKPDVHCTFCGKILLQEDADIPSIFFELLIYELNGESDQICRKFVCKECTSKLKKDMK
jgi:hypothetical protein